jgi:hypothetical protein
MYRGLTEQNHVTILSQPKLIEMILMDGILQSRLAQRIPPGGRPSRCAPKRSAAAKTSCMILLGHANFVDFAAKIMSSHTTLYSSIVDIHTITHDRACHAAFFASKLCVMVKLETVSLCRIFVALVINKYRYDYRQSSTTTAFIFETQP